MSTILTDLEKFIETYKQFGIDVETYKDQDKIKVNLSGDHENATHSNKLDGYTYFYSVIEFTKEGEFLQQGFWE